MGSSASLPAEKPAVQHKSVAPTEKARVSSMPNSVSGSKQSIRSRKGNSIYASTQFSVTKHKKLQDFQV